MAKGGKRPGAGRKKNAATQKTIAVAEKVSESGITPLEVMIENMRFFHGEANKLLEQMTDGITPEAFKAIMGLKQAAEECAKDAAPFMHPRLAAIEHTGPNKGPIQHAVGFEDQALLERYGIRLTGS